MRAVVLLLLYAAMASPAFAKEECKARVGDKVSGIVTSVSDGDTFAISADRVRLFGLDAPESGNAGGAESRKALRDLIEGQPVACEVVDKDRWRRCVSVCLLGNADITERMIRDGRGFMFRSFAHFSKFRSRYDDAEQDARANQRGFWAQ